MGEQAVNAELINWSDRLTFTAGEDIDEGNTLYVDTDNSVKKWVSGTSYIGMSLVDASSGEVVTVVTDGVMRVVSTAHGLSAGTVAHAVAGGGVGNSGDAESRVGIITDASDANALVIKID